MDYRKLITKKMPKILRAIGISSSSESEDEWNNSNLCDDPCLSYVI
jgi:hypothetical protein